MTFRMNETEINCRLQASQTFYSNQDQKSLDATKAFDSSDKEGFKQERVSLIFQHSFLSF